MRLALIHQPPGATPCPPGAALWQTCLRDVLFVQDSPAAVDNRVVTDADAYAVLLEVVCGLRSPLAGETEVQAQFKTFLGSLDTTNNRELLRVGQRVLADAKSIRQHHLQGVGVVAYGPLAASFVPPGRRVVIVGTGALAGDLSIALADRHRIDRWGRKLADGRPGYFVLSTAPMGPVRSTEQVTLIIAAPVPQTDVDALATCYTRIVDVIDLRGRRERPSFAHEGRLITLDHLFSESAHLGPATHRIDAARREIRELSRAFATRDELRPFGWEDLCA